jgi:hypothetical protein
VESNHPNPDTTAIVAEVTDRLALPVDVRRVRRRISSEEPVFASGEQANCLPCPFNPTLEHDI